MKKKVEVVPRPAVRAIEFEQKFPSYAGLKPQPRQRGDLTLLLGSELKIRVTANKKITGGVVFLKNATGETEQEQPLTVAGKESEQSSASLKLDELNITGFSVRLKDKYGYEIGDYPNSEWVSNRTISLPLSAALKTKDIEDVIEAVLDVLQKNKR